MKYFLLIFVLPPFLCFSQTAKVKLIDYSADKIPAFCGYQKVATTLKFKLLEKLNGLKPDQDILVIIKCPREFGIENYKNNKIYKLTIFDGIKGANRNIGQGYKIFYKYEKETLKRFWSKEMMLTN